MANEQAVHEKIEELMKKTKCSKNFECYKSGFKNLTKVKKFEGKDLIQCLGQNPHQCEFSSPFGNAYFCKCQLRAYIAGKLGK